MEPAGALVQLARAAEQPAVDRPAPALRGYLGSRYQQALRGNFTVLLFLLDLARDFTRRVLTEIRSEPDVSEHPRELVFGQLLPQDFGGLLRPTEQNYSLPPGCVLFPRDLGVARGHKAPEPTTEEKARELLEFWGIALGTDGFPQDPTVPREILGVTKDFLESFFKYTSDKVKADTRYEIFRCAQREGLELDGKPIRKPEDIKTLWLTQPVTIKIAQQVYNCLWPPFMDRPNLNRISTQISYGLGIWFYPDTKTRRIGRNFIETAICKQVATSARAPFQSSSENGVRISSRCPDGMRRKARNTPYEFDASYVSGLNGPENQLWNLKLAIASKYNKKPQLVTKEEVADHFIDTVRRPKLPVVRNHPPDALQDEKVSRPTLHLFVVTHWYCLV